MSSQNEDTINWYNQNAWDYFEETKEFSMQEKYPQFLKYIPNNGEILDAGCGSGRDSKEFSKLGYKVTSFDASEELAHLASKNAGLRVINSTFEKFTIPKKFDGIWANASLLHVSKEDFESSFANLIKHLKVGGVLYASMKRGNTQEKDFKGRFFNYVTPQELRNLFSKYENLELLEMTQNENTFRIGDRPFITFIVKKIK